MTIAELSGPPVEVWPDNLQAVNIFIQCGTQWRVGMAGATGLDYNALPPVLRMAGIARADWPELFESIRIMESSALKTMREQT